MKAGPLLRLRDPDGIRALLPEPRHTIRCTPELDDRRFNPGTQSLASCRCSVLGSRSFPAIGAFATLSSEQPSVVYSSWDLRPNVGSSAAILAQTVLIPLLKGRCSRSPQGESTRAYSCPPPRVAPPLSGSNTRHPIQVSSSFICSMRCVTHGTSYISSRAEWGVGLEHGVDPAPHDPSIDPGLRCLR